MRVSAEVLRCEGGRVWLKPAREGCGRCHEPGGCAGTDVLNGFFGPRCQSWQVESPEIFPPGRIVEIELPDGEGLRAASLIYILPLGGMLLGAALGYLLVAGDVAVLLGLVLGLGAAIALSVRLARARRTVGPRILH